MKVSEICKQCHAGATPDMAHATRAPKGLCPLCWAKFGRAVPVCTTADKLPKKEEPSK